MTSMSYWMQVSEVIAYNMWQCYFSSAIQQYIFILVFIQFSGNHFSSYSLFILDKTFLSLDKFIFTELFLALCLTVSHNSYSMQQNSAFLL